MQLRVQQKQLEQITNGYINNWKICIWVGLNDVLYEVWSQYASWRNWNNSSFKTDFKFLGCLAYACQLKNYFYCSKEFFLPARILDSDLTNDSNSIANVALHFPHPEPEDAILIVQRCVLIQ